MQMGIQICATSTQTMMEYLITSKYKQMALSLLQVVWILMVMALMMRTIQTMEALH